MSMLSEKELKEEMKDFAQDIRHVFVIENDSDGFLEATHISIFTMESESKEKKQCNS